MSHTVTPPHAAELEQIVLGAILIDRDAFPAIMDILKPESFYVPAHQKIFDAARVLNGRGDPIDILTISEQMRKAGTLDASGGSAFIAELSGRVASAANLEYHARIVAQKALLRGLIFESQKSLGLAYAADADAFGLLYDTQKRLFDLANFGGRQAQSIGSAGMEVLKAAEIAMQIPDGITGVPSGLQAIDKTTGGFQPSDLIILAARPGMGKTALALCLALNPAKAGIPVAFFSMEMSRHQLAQRIVSMETGISSQRIRRGQITADEMRRISECTQTLQDVPLHIDDTPGLGIFELKAKARRMQMQHGVKFVIVDYLQLMQGDKERNANREQEISSISRGLKSLAKELDIPVLALSQLSRGVESRADKRPLLSDLRESGSIEQDSDIVAFLYRESYYAEDHEDISLTEFLVRKHRHGPLADIGLNFEKATTKFSDVGLVSNQFPTVSIPAGVGRSEDAPF